jgi:hypothetical protein
MLTWEDCPDCCGTGIIIEETAADQTAPTAPESTEEQR